jgi:hypothetical protein
MRLEYYKRSAVIFVSRIDPVAAGYREMYLHLKPHSDIVNVVQQYLLVELIP